MKTVLDYRLFAAPPLEEDEARRTFRDAEFYLLTPRYALVYTTEEIYGAVEIRGERIQALNAMEQAWLISCGETIAARQRAEQAAQAEERRRQFLEEFEEELRKEWEDRHGTEETAGI